MTDLRFVLGCAGLDSALTVRRPKPVRPLITAPQRESANSEMSLSFIAAALALTRIDIAKSGVTIAIPASEIISLVVTVFIVIAASYGLVRCIVLRERWCPLQGPCQ